MPRTQSTVRSEPSEELSSRVSKLESTLHGLKLAATVLGLTGAALLVFVLYVSRQAGQALEASQKGEKTIQDAVERGREELGNSESSAKSRLNRYLDEVVAITPEVTWKIGGEPLSLGVKESEGVCFLTRINGKLEGSDEEVSIRLIEGSFALVGKSKQCCLEASARCIKFGAKPV